MKRLILIIMGLCLCTALYADMNTYIIGAVSAGGECTTLHDSQTGANVADLSVGASSTKIYRATTFTASGSYSACKITVALKAVGSPTGNITMYLYTSNHPTAPTDPNELVATCTVALDSSTVTDSYADYDFNFSGASITSGVEYYIVLHKAYDSGNYIHWSAATAAGEWYSYSADTSTWTSSTGQQGLFKTYSE